MNVKGRYFLESKWEEFAQKVGIPSLKKDPFTSPRPEPLQVGSTQRFLRFFCWPCSSASMDAFACVEIVDAGRKNHENMDSNHRCEQTRSNHWKQTSTQVSPSYLEYLGIYT